MPTDEVLDIWMRSLGEEDEGAAAALPDDAPKVVMRGADEDEAAPTKAYGLRHL